MEANGSSSSAVSVLRPAPPPPLTDCWTPSLSTRLYPAGDREADEAAPMAEEAESSFRFVVHGVPAEMSVTVVSGVVGVYGYDSGLL